MAGEKKHTFLSVVFIIISVILLVDTVGVLFLTVYLKVYRNPDVENILFDADSVAAETKIYRYSCRDRQNGCRNPIEVSEDKLYGGGKCIPIEYSELPENLVNAFVAIEDKRFFTHNGVDLMRTFKAANMMFHFDSQFGASTITQQLVKNATGDDEVTTQRKIREIFKALRLEEDSDKSQILESYLNIINLSSGCRGVGAAAERYFGKTVGELTLAECASIAAITNNPSRYDPLHHPEDNKSRRDLILSQMLEQGYIGDSEYREALASPIDTSSGIERVGERVNSWFTDMLAEDVIRDLCEKLGYSRNQASQLVYYGGLDIYSTQDAEIQSLLDNYFSDENNIPQGTNGRPQAAMIVIDSQNGDILAVCGGVGQKSGNRVINHATDSLHSPGSTIKPVSAYAQALEKGIINWATVYEDTPVKVTRLSNGRIKQWPANSDRVYRGRTDIATAVARSTNTVAVKVVGDVGIDESFDFMKNRLGMKNLVGREKNTNDLNQVSLGLGQLAYGITVRELAGAYSSLVDGVYKRPRSYYKVVDRNGNVLLSNEDNSEVVFSRNTAAIMTKLLENVVTNGTARGLKAPKGVSVAAKTGTTQNNCDRWLMAYTPELLTGIWMGYEYPKPLDGINGNRCISIFNSIFQSIYAGANYGKTEFDMPDSIIELSYCKLTGRLSQSGCDDNGTERIGWFDSDNIPTDDCTEHLKTETE